MAQITFNIEITPLPNKKGLHNIRVRMTQNRKHRRFNLGYAIEKNQWDEQNQRVNKKHPLHIIINAAITSRRQEIEKEYLTSIPTNRPISIRELQKKAKQDVLGGSYIDFFQEHVSNMDNPSTAITFRKVLAKLNSYTENRDIYFGEINFEFVQGFLKYLKNIGNSPNTIHHNYKTLRSIYNHAVKQRRFTPSFVSPFYGHDVKRKKVKRNKLDENDILKLEQYTPLDNSPKFHAKNFFLLSYYLLGVRSSSMIKMRWENIKDERCIYNPAKGQERQDIPVGKKAMEILNYYKKNNPKSQDFIFPYLRGITLTGEALIRKLDIINSMINNELGEIAKDLGLEKKITTHVARHSFAYNSRRKSNNDIYAVQKALGHSSIVITEAYFNDEESSDSDRLSKLMFE